MTPIGLFLKKKNFGPVVQSLVYLDDSDMKKLSFVFSSSKKEMEKNYEEFRSMKLLGLKTETQKFDPRQLSFYQLIPELNSFVDGIQVPIQLSEKDKKYILSHWKEYNTKVFKSNDFFNIKFGIEIGEKIEKSVLTAMFIRDKYSSIIRIVSALMDNYMDPFFVYKMLPLKAIATVIDSCDRNYIQLLSLFKIFGMRIVYDIIEYFEPEYFFRKWMISTFSYSRYVNLKIEGRNDPLDEGIVQEIVDEGKELKHLCELLAIQYPEMKDMVVTYVDLDFMEKTIYGFDDVIECIQSSMYELCNFNQFILINKN
jgi:hypothetical protein